MIKVIIGAALSLSVATIGAGVLAIPATFEADGVFLVLLTLCIVAFFTVISIDYLVLCIEKLNARSYEEISDELLGHSFKQFIRLLLIVYNCGTAVGYIVVISDIFTPLLPYITPIVPFLNSPTRVIVIMWGIVMLPLSCIPRISHLHLVSSLAIAATFFISGIIVFRYIVPIDETSSVVSHTNSTLTSHEPRKYDKAHAHSMQTSSAILALPVVMFAFDCQSLVFQTYVSLQHPSRSMMSTVALISVIVTAFIYACVGYFGYATYSPEVNGNILTNYNPLQDHIFAIGELAYTITVMLAYALILLPCRDAIFHFIFGYSHTHETLKIPACINLIVSVLLSTVCLILALWTPGFLFIILLMGAFCSSILCYVYPALFRLRLHALGLAPYEYGEQILVTAMLILGVVGIVVGILVVSSLYNIWKYYEYSTQHVN